MFPWDSNAQITQKNANFEPIDQIHWNPGYAREQIDFRFPEQKHACLSQDDSFLFVFWAFVADAYFLTSEFKTFQDEVSFLDGSYD